MPNQPRLKSSVFDDARGSATECAACLDALVAKGIVSADRIVDGKTMLLRAVCMLSGLVDRFDDTTGRLHEDVVEYRVSSENTGDSRRRKSKRKRRINTN